MFGENQLIFALDPKLELDTETLVLRLGPKFLCFVVHFYEYFWFWYQTEIVSKKVYAMVWLVLEITALNSLFHAIKTTAHWVTQTLCKASFIGGESFKYLVYYQNSALNCIWARFFLIYR